MTPHTTTNPASSRLLLACGEIERAVAAGATRPADDFVHALARDDDAVIEVIYTEFAARCRLGDPPSPDEYYARFPAYAARLRRQFEVHEFLSGMDEVAADANGDTGATRGAVTPLGSGAAFPSATTPWRGVHVAGYQLTGELGRGATGLVFAARHVGLDRPTAIKMLALSPNTDREALRRFQQEARLLAALRHANIVDVIDVVENEQGAFLVMELVGGGNLASRCAGRPQPFDWAANLMARLARAVQFAHERGIVHRDLKPANVLLDERGEPKIADFGLATWFVREDGHSSSGCIVGTPSYMAPEQAAGKRDVSPAADVYGLGAIFYELLTGRPPFTGESPLDALQQVLHEEPVPPSRLRPKIPRDLETICAKCLRKEPRDRYDSAVAVADDLERFARMEPIRARPISRLGRAWRWCRRHPTVAVLSGLCAALVLIVAIGSPVAAYHLHRQQLATEHNLSRAVVAENEASHRLWDSYVAQARALRWSGRQGQRFVAMDALAQASTLAAELGLDDEATLAMRNEAIACLAQCDVRVEHRWTAFAEPLAITGIAFDAQVRRVAMQDESGFVTISRLEDRRRERNLDLTSLASGGEVVFAKCEFSPDDALLAVECERAGGGTDIGAWRVATGELLWHRPVVAQDEQRQRHFVFARGGAALATLDVDRSIILLDAATGEVLRRVLPANDDVRGVVAYPDEDKLSYWTNRAVHVVAIDDGQEVLRHETPTSGNIVCAAWSGDRQFLAVGTTDHYCHLWDAWVAETPRTLEGHQSWVRHVAFHPAGDILATCAVDGTTRFYDVWSGRGELVAEGTLCRFSRDGRRAGFGFSGDTVGRWRFAANEAREVLRDQSVAYEAYDYVAVRHDNRILATKSSNEIQVWDATNHRTLHCIDEPEPWHVLFGPSSGNLFSVAADGRVTRRKVSIQQQDKQGHGVAVNLGEPEQVAKAEYGCGTSLSVAGNRQRGFVCLGFLETYKPADASRRPRTLADVDGERFIYYEGLHEPQISGNGRWIAGAADGEHAVLVVDAESGDIVARALEGGTGAAVAFSPDSRRLVAMSKREFVSIDTASWRVLYRGIRPAEAKTPRYVVFSPDGKLLAACETSSGLILLDSQTGEAIADLPSRSGALPHRPTFTADGARIATLAERQHVRIWNLGLVREQLDNLGLTW